MHEFFNQHQYKLFFFAVYTWNFDFNIMDGEKVIFLRIHTYHIIAWICITHAVAQHFFFSFPPSAQDISFANKSIFRVRLCIWCFNENLISNPSTWTFVVAHKIFWNFVELVICFASNSKWAAPQSGLTEHAQ